MKNDPERLARLIAKANEGARDIERLLTEFPDGQVARYFNGSFKLMEKCLPIYTARFIVAPEIPVDEVLSEGRTR